MTERKNPIKSYLVTLEQEFNLNPVGVLQKLQEVEDMVVNGYEQEKVAPRGVVVTVVEKDLHAAIKIQKMKWDIWQWLQKNQEKVSLENGQISLLPPLKEELLVIPKTKSEIEEEGE